MIKCAALLTVIALAWALPALAQPGGCPPNASNCRVTTTSDGTKALSVILEGWTTSGTDKTLSGKLGVGSGTSQFNYNSWPAKKLDIQLGSTATPTTQAGPTVKISRTETMAVADCANIADTECNAALMVSSRGSATTQMVTSGAEISAVGSSTVSATDVQGLNAHGRVIGSGVGVGMGAYLEGRRDTNTARALGAEISAWNWTGSDCTYTNTQFPTCGGIWIVPRGKTALPTKLSSAVHVGTSGDGVSIWQAGVTLNSGSVDATGFGFDDNSSSGTSIRVAGTHTNAIDVTGTVTNLLRGSGVLLTNAGQAVLGSPSAVTVRAVSTHKLQLLQTSELGLLTGRWSNNATGGLLDFYKSRGATVGARATVTNDDSIAVLGFFGDDGTGDTAAARITAAVNTTGTVSAGVVPGKLILSTATTTGVMTNGIMIDAAQNLIVGAGFDKKIFDTNGALYDAGSSRTIPTTGATVTIADTADEIILDPAGTLATLTVVLPTCSAAYTGKSARLASSQIVTTLTVNATAGTVKHPPAALAAGESAQWRCVGSVTSWFRIG